MLIFGKKRPKMAKNGPGRNGTPPKTGKTGPKRGEFGTQTLGGAEREQKFRPKEVATLVIWHEFLTSGLLLAAAYNARI